MTNFFAILVPFCQNCDVLPNLPVKGPSAFLSFDPYGNQVIIETTDVKRTVRLPEARRGARQMVKEFVDSIRENREPVMSGEEGLKDLAVVLGAYQSAEQGRQVSLTPP